MTINLVLNFQKKNHKCELLYAEVLTEWCMFVRLNYLSDGRDAELCLGLFMVIFVNQWNDDAIRCQTLPRQAVPL